MGQSFPAASGRAAGAALAATLLATGAAGLIYQVAWQRQIAVLIGVDHVATAVTLAVFLSGLSLGYALCGRVSQRVRDALRVYAMLEAGIGLWGLAFPWTYRAVTDLLESLALARPLGLIFGALLAAALLLLVPALLMGATVPLLTRALVASSAGLTGTHAWVYGLNTLGAVAGALTATFWLVPALDPAGAVRVAAWIGVGAAAVLLVLSSPTLRPGEPAGIARAVRPEGVRYSTATLAVVATLGGAATMSQENAMVRLLGLTVGPTPYVFGLVVAAFVAAIALGSLAVSRLSYIGAGALWGAAALGAIGWLLLYPTYDAWPWLAHVLRVAVQPNAAGFVVDQLLVWGLLLAATLLGAAPLGALLPLAFHESRAGVESGGRVSGSLLAWNALGAVAGSLLGGTLLYRWLDLGQVLLVAPLLASVIAFVAGPGIWRRVAAGGLALASAVALVGSLGFAPERLAMGTFRMREATPFTFLGPGPFHEARMVNRRIVAREDGPLASVAVVASPDWEFPMPPPLALFVNGKSDSNTLQDRETLRLSAHLPALLAEAQARALVVGQGTGVTAGELARWPGVRTIDLVEVSPEVARALPLFAAHTGSVHENPRLRLRVEDVRLTLRRPGPRWDLIVSEPSNPWSGGSDLLFTLEFYRSVEARLAPGGVFLQWLQVYESDPALVCRMTRTLRAVFPALRAFRGTTGDWLVLATREPIDDAALARAAARLEEAAAVRASLAELSIASLDDLLAREILAFPAYAAREVEPCAVHRSGSARLADDAARAMFRGQVVDESLLLAPEEAGRE